MKKLHILLAAVLSLALASNVHAQGSFQFQTEKLQFQVGQTAAGQDTSSLLGMTTSTVLTATKDTTLWASLAGKRFSQPGFTDAPILQGSISASGSSDSVGYQIQFATDPADPTKFYTTSQAYLVFGSDTQKQFNVILPTSAANSGYRYRVIVWANDTGGVVHTYRVSSIWRAGL